MLLESFLFPFTPNLNPNGIAIYPSHYNNNNNNLYYNNNNTPHRQYLFISDTAFADGYGRENPTLARSNIKYDLVDKQDGMGLVPIHPRLFANIDQGVPDGLKIDSKGRLYAGCGDGLRSNIYIILYYIIYILF